VHTKCYPPNGRIHIRRGWSDRNDLSIHDKTTRSNVIAISGPAGVGKSSLIAHLLNRNNERFVFVDKDSVRPPTKLEKNGKMPYRRISVWDIIDCNEPQLCSMNVGICLEPCPEWIYWMKKTRLANLGVFIPEAEEMVACSDEFINRYLVNGILKQHSELNQNQVLLLEISTELEDDFVEIFPEITIIRLNCEKGTRAKRLIERYSPKSHHEWVIASLKVLDSVSFSPPLKKSSKNCYEAKNETKEDMHKLASLIEEVVKAKKHHCIAKEKLAGLGRMFVMGHE